MAVVRVKGKRVRTAVLDVRVIASLRASVRVGVVVPKYAHNVVARNLLKRRLRELVRLEWLPLLPPMDVLLRVLPSAYERDFDALRVDMRRAGERLHRMTLVEQPSSPV